VFLKTSLFLRRLQDIWSTRT